VPDECCRQEMFLQLFRRRGHYTLGWLSLQARPATARNHGNGASIGRREIDAHEHRSDEWVLKGLRVRDEDAYRALLERYGDALYRFFYFSHGNRDLADDQCGETFEVLVRGIGKMRSQEGRSLKPFLFGIARNVLRRSWRRAEPQREDDGALDEIAEARASVLQEMAAREELERALAAIHQFPEPQRQILLLRFVEEFRLEDIAEVMGIPLNSVKSHIHRSRQKLLQRLGVDS
jgi:RNA polymerase sigma factor (sigma-70 family)